jgi:hypothetical protein
VTTNNQLKREINDLKQRLDEAYRNFDQAKEDNNILIAEIN